MLDGEIRKQIGLSLPMSEYKAILAVSLELRVPMAELCRNAVRKVVLGLGPIKRDKGKDKRKFEEGGEAL